MKMTSEKRYSLTDLTFKQIEVICLGLEELDRAEIDPERVLIAEEITRAIDKELKA